MIKDINWTRVVVDEETKRKVKVRVETLSDAARYNTEDRSTLAK